MREPPGRGLWRLATRRRPTARNNPDASWTCHLHLAGANLRRAHLNQRRRDWREARKAGGQEKHGATDNCRP
eukprot:5578708-Alexandrium_andersonii.AAC.1